MSVPALGVFRFSRPERGYAPIANQFSRSKLPARAVKVGLYVLSHRDGFVQTQDQIAAAIDMSPKTVRAALVDLEQGRFLVRTDVRGDTGQRLGTAYAITDVPFTEEELETLTGDSPGGESPPGESPGHKKTRSRRDTTEPEKTIPSGGSPSGEREAPADHQEEPVQDPPTLDLDLPEPVAEIRPRQNGKSAATVVAAYVDSYREHHSGGDPIQRDKGRVARDAAQLLRGRATVEELVQAATAMGCTPYANLGVQLNILRDAGTGRKAALGPAPVAPREAFEEAGNAARREFMDRLRTDPATARWVAEDPAEMEKLCREDPTLRPVFEAAVSAA